MILFYEDWKKYPTAIIHSNTKNESFLRLSSLYKSLGLKNHAFLLALHNPDLKDVDPFSDNLTQAQQVAILKECFENPWYFFREIVRLPMAGSTPVPLIANRGNIAYFWSFYNHLTSMLILPRQFGKSSANNSIMLQVLNFGGYNIKVILLTRGDDLRVKNIKEIKAMLDSLPSYLKIRTKKDSDNDMNITFNAMNNRLDVFVAQNDPESANKQGRGLTTPIIFVDEYAFYNYIDITIPAAFAAMTAARDAAIKNNSPWGIGITTTPGYVKSRSGAFAKKDYDKSCRFMETMYDIENQTALHEFVEKNTQGYKNKQLLIEFNHRQLGKTDDWLREAIALSKVEADRAEAEFLNKWSFGDISSPIDKQTILKLQDSMKNPEYIEIFKNNFAVNWYYDMDGMVDYEDKPFIIGMDTSEMSGKDDTTLVMRDISTGEVIGTGRYNDSNLLSFADFLADLLYRYPYSILVPEAKSTGVMIIDYLLKILPTMGLDPFRRIYNNVVDQLHLNDNYYDIVRTKVNYRDDVIYDQYKKHFGFRTAGMGAKSRDLLYGQVFNSALKHTAHCANDKVLVSQLLSLQRKKGRIDHPDGGHDDLVISFLLTMWFLLFAKNKEYYGIEEEEVLISAKLRSISNEGGEEKIVQRIEQTDIKNEIKHLITKAKYTKDKNAKQIIINKLTMLYNELEPNTDNIASIYELIENLKLEQKK